MSFLALSSDKERQVPPTSIPRQLEGGRGRLQLLVEPPLCGAWKSCPALGVTSMGRESKDPGPLQAVSSGLPAHAEYREPCPLPLSAPPEKLVPTW